jgi:hypothetical protein
MSYYRVAVPVTKSFREIAKRERRSIAQQAAVALEQFERAWQQQHPEKIDKPMSRMGG